MGTVLFLYAGMAFLTACYSVPAGRPPSYPFKPIAGFFVLISSERELVDLFDKLLEAGREMRDPFFAGFGILSEFAYGVIEQAHTA